MAATGGFCIFVRMCVGSCGPAHPGAGPALLRPRLRAHGAERGPGDHSPLDPVLSGRRTPAPAPWGPALCLRRVPSLPPPGTHLPKTPFPHSPKPCPIPHGGAPSPPQEARLDCGLAAPTCPVSCENRVSVPAPVAPAVCCPGPPRAPRHVSSAEPSLRPPPPPKPPVTPCGGLSAPAHLCAGLRCPLSREFRCFEAFALVPAALSSAPGSPCSAPPPRASGARETRGQGARRAGG